MFRQKKINKGSPYFLLVSLDSRYSCLPYSRPKALGSNDKNLPLPAIEARKTSLLVNMICYRLLTAMTIDSSQSAFLEAFYIKNLKSSINEGIKASKE